MIFQEDEETETAAALGFVRKHYEEKGYRVHSGLQFGVEFVLYADQPDLVHSDFCIHVIRNGKNVTAAWNRNKNLGFVNLISKNFRIAFFSLALHNL
jgi:tRNA splicing endonuclease